MGMFDFFKKYTITKTDTISELTKKVDTLTSLSTSIRPMDVGQNTYNRSATGVYGFNRITERDLKEVADYSDIVRNVFNSLRNECFRNGVDCQPLSNEGDETQKKKIDKILQRANNNGQTLIEVLMEFEDDLNTFDNAYLLILKDYLINNNKEVLGGNVTEVIRVDPLVCEFMLDKKQRLGYNEAGNKVYFRLHDRKELTEDAIDDKSGLPNLQAHFRITSEDGYIYYNSSELLHCSKYKPSKTYGLSPLYALYNKLMILITQDYYIRQYYGSDKPVKSLLFLNTKNKQSLIANWDELLQKKRRNPHQLYPFVVENQEGRPPAQFVKTMDSLSEMQYTEVRNEIRQQIGAVYGVSPLFLNDNSASGGLNNEGLQITVTNRAIELAQSMYNDKVFPFIFEKNLGITDWRIELFPSEEEDDIHMLDKQAKEIANAKAMADMGLNVKYTEDGEFVVQPGKVEAQEEKIIDEFSPFGSLKSVEKAGPIPKKEQVKFQSALDAELNKLIKELDLSKKPTEKQLLSKVDKIGKALEKKLGSKASNMFKAIYRKAAQATHKELGEKFSMQEKDKNVLDALKHDPTYQKAFATMSTSMTANLTSVIKQAYDDPKTFTIDKLTSKLREEVDKGESSLRTIARTETSKISAAARKTSYEKTGAFDTFKFKWIGPSDSRTTQMSKDIKRATEKGVSWDTLVKTIERIVGKYNPKWELNKEAPITHPNSRHTFIRVIE